MSQAQAQVKIEELVAQIASLTKRVEELEAKSTTKSNVAGKEMTDDDARKILNGEFASLKHNDAASKLGLSYGQVYSCRGEYTFKHIHKELKQAGWVNPFVKK